MGFAVVCNFMIELIAFCTSIVIENDQGTVFHGRNFDFVLHSPALANMVFKGEVYRGDELVYTGNWIAF